MYDSHRGLHLAEAGRSGDADPDDNGPKVECPNCQFLVPLKRAIGPRGRRPLTCPRCQVTVALPS